MRDVSWISFYVRPFMYVRSCVCLFSFVHGYGSVGVRITYMRPGKINCAFGFSSVQAMGRGIAFVTALLALVLFTGGSAAVMGSGVHIACSGKGVHSSNCLGKVTSTCALWRPCVHKCL